MGGKEAGVLERNNPRNLTLPTVLVDDRAGQGSTVVLDILVHALGRVNFGCVWDFKGLVSPTVLLNGELSAPVSFAALLTRPVTCSSGLHAVG